MAILGADRRRWRRAGLEELPDVQVVRVAGENVIVVNASGGGLLIDSLVRLTPGAEHQVEVVLPAAVVRARGRVLRSEVSMLGGSVLKYRAAIQFARPINELDGPDPTTAPEPDTDLLGFTFLSGHGDALGPGSAAPVSSWAW